MLEITKEEKLAIRGAFWRKVPDELLNDLKEEAVVRIVGNCVYKVLAKPSSYPNGFSSSNLKNYSTFELNLAYKGVFMVVVNIEGGKRTSDPLVYDDPKIIVKIKEVS